MSAYYSDLIHTNLPDSVDNFASFQDVGIATKPYVDQYLQYMESGDTASAAAVLASHPEIKSCLINADRLNSIRDGLLALERMFVSDIENYVINVVTEKGEWSSTASYRKNDVVSYEIEGAVEIFRCIGDSEDPTVTTIPAGILPTNTRYWQPLTLRGAQGVSGSGLSPRGAWNSTITYGIDDMVVYNNAWWVATETNVGETPSDSSTKWVRYFEYRMQISTAESQPSNQLTGEMWFQKQTNGIWKELVKTNSGYSQIVTRNAVPITISASSWSSTSPSSVVITNTNIKNATGGVVYLSPSATQAQKEAAEKAGLFVGTKTSNGLPIYAYNDTPTQDIPLVVEINNDYAYFFTALPGGGGSRPYTMAISKADWGENRTITIAATTHKKGSNFCINVYCTDSTDTTKYFTTYGTITTFDWKAVVDNSGNVTLTTTTAFTGKVVLS